jgi:2-keto-4-pentenoate hydratase/2-oxohepta-3-ene-1,7-dioic acid hydratase in catechol pathway
MKLATFINAGRDEVGFTIDDGAHIVSLQDAYKAASLGVAPASMTEVIGRIDEVRKAVQNAKNNPSSVRQIDANTVAWRAPVTNPSKILCVGMNNVKLSNGAHVNPKGPLFFLKPPSCLIGHKQTIEIADDYGYTFPEPEPAIIIGKRAKNVSVADAMDYVFGYTIHNDVTSPGLKAQDSIAVDLSADQKGMPGFDTWFSYRKSRGPDDLSVYLTYHTRSKGCDTFGAMGPWLVTSDEVNDPGKIEVRGYIDGEMFCEDTTANYSYNIAKVIEFASRYFTLEPGDLVSCGTAAHGVGRFKRGHQDVDLSVVKPVIDVEIPGMGRLSNPVRHTWEA